MFKGLNFILLSSEFVSYIAAKLRAEAAEIEHNAQLATQEAVRSFLKKESLCNQLCYKPRNTFTVKVEG